ncbi:MAG: hypothetical protein AAF639_07655 [Chloroflexota bacterium]
MTIADAAKADHYLLAEGFQRIFQLDSDIIVTSQIELLHAFVRGWKQQLSEEPESLTELRFTYASLLDSRLRLLIQMNTNRSTSNSTLNALLMLLRLGVDQITTSEHLQAFEFGLETLLTPHLKPEHIDLVDDALLNVGVEARADFGDPVLLQKYIEIL